MEQPPIFCRKCGERNDANAWRCVKCGDELHPAHPQVIVEDGLVATVIPYRNVPALFAYYLGVFSVIPCLGAPLGIVAFFCGIVGLRIAKQRPDAHGKVHAWVGIVVGGIFGLIYSLAIIFAIIAAIQDKL